LKNNQDNEQVIIYAKNEITKIKSNIIEEVKNKIERKFEQGYETSLVKEYVKNFEEMILRTI